MADAGNGGLGVCNIVMDIGNNSVLVCSVLMSVGASCTCVYLSSVWKWKVSNGHTEMVEHTLKTCQTLLRSNLQVAIASLSSFAW